MFLPVSSSFKFPNLGLRVSIEKGLKSKGNAMYHMLRECPKTDAAFRQPGQALLPPS
jgi:hypothetical protein